MAFSHDPKIFALVVGRLVASLRDRNGLSQAVLAKEIGLTQPTLSRIERGQAQVDIYTFTRVADRFGFTPAELHNHVHRALERSEMAARGVAPSPKTPDSEPDSPWWQGALTLGGAAGLGGLVAFAVSAALDEKKKNKRS